MIDLQQILFWIFSFAMLGAAALAVTRDNVVNSAMLLLQVFLCMAGIFLLLHAFFLAIIQVLVYAGAVVVLFLFVIMLLQPQQEQGAFSALATTGAAVCFLALAVAAMFVATGSIELSTAVGATAQAGVNAGVNEVAEQAEVTLTQGGLRQVVQPIFSTYLLPFQLIALILLSAMIGVVVLSRKDPDEG